MKQSAIILIALLAVVGCKTEMQETKANFDPFPKSRLAAIYTDLKTLPIPVPHVTPFDKDNRQRDAYLAGFRDGWDFAISGDILFEFRSQPSDLPADLSPAWGDGWHDGTRLGGERLSAKLREK